MSIRVKALIVTSCVLIFATGSTRASDSNAAKWLKGNELTWDLAHDAPDVRPKYHALVIGIDDYTSFPDGSGWEPLLTPRGDAAAVAKLLEDKYGFEVNSLFDEEATRSNIMKAFDKIVRLSLDDALVIYFSGHGYYDRTLGEGFWIPQDARRIDGGRPASGEWLWNSTLTKILGASRARHILVVADSCYGGSLFRGGEEIMERRRLKWYRRANARPSRYLLTSGDLEPVLDTGARHSIFAQQLLNYLEYPDRDVFSVTDLGSALRTKVSALTGQMVRMGPLKVSSHAGGEFVFVRSGSEFPRNTDATPEKTEPANDGPSRDFAARTDQQVLQDAVLLKKRGAPDSAEAMLKGVESGSDDGRLLDIVKEYVQTERGSDSYDSLDSLITRLEQRKDQLDQSDWQDPKVARPRVLVCTGPVDGSGGTESASLALLYRVSLDAALRRHAGTRIVDRETIEDVLREMNLGTSLLSDKNARLTVGKMLPASLLLLGNLVHSEQGESLYLKLVDTETTELLETIWLDNIPGRTLVDVCREAAEKISQRSVKARPLSVQIETVRENEIHAGIGEFHGANTGMVFRVMKRVPREEDHPLAYDESQVGVAEIDEIGEWASAFAVQWDERPDPESGASLWIRE
jgi:hypothetical protein